MSSHGSLDQVGLGHTIRIDHQAEWRPGCSDPNVASDAGEGALFELDQANRGKLMLDDLCSLIGRAVDYDHVELNGSPLVDNRSQTLADCALRVIARDDDR